MEDALVLSPCWKPVPRISATLRLHPMARPSNEKRIVLVRKLVRIAVIANQPFTFT